ncbi:MAG: tol-pal system protein YbgF [Colwellia sp.]
MKLNQVLLGILLASTTHVVLANTAPVEDVVTGLNSTATTGSETVAQQITRQLASTQRSQVNLQRQLDELQIEMNELRGLSEQHAHQLGQVLERQRELYLELDRRVNEALKEGNRAASNQQVQPLTQDYSNNLTENEAYDKALNLVLKEKRYEQAIPEFRAFNKNFPDSSYAANAHYWLGQLLFNKQELVEADKEFSLVVNRFKASSKRPDAMLKLAISAEKQNKNTDAIALYKQLIKEYPSSNSAHFAKPRLSSLEK